MKDVIKIETEHSVINQEDQSVLPDSYEQARSQINDITWKHLAGITVQQALETWFTTLGLHTAKNYRSGFLRLIELAIVNSAMNLQAFSLINHESVVDDIKMINDWSEATKQARAAAYISFTGFLQRRTQGIVRKAVANKEGANKTFFKVRDKVKTEALSQPQTRQFIQQIEKINERDGLIAKLILQGGKRKEEVLNVKIEDIDFTKKQITFVQTKTRGMEKVTIINYPDHVMQELKTYIADRTGLVFITRNHKKVAPFQIDRNFYKAGLKAGIPFRVTPHVLRVTLVTRLKELKVQDTDIMKITGHANPAQLSAYDKSDMGDNASLYHHFV